jgi:phage-related protein
MKPLRWIASSKKDLSAMPIKIRRAVGYALFAAQQDEKHKDAKVLSRYFRLPGVFTAARGG